MKKILLTLLLLTGLRASAFDWTYSTNLFWSITTPTNIFCGTNSTDPARDSYIVIWNKLNADINLMWQRILTGTNGGGGGGGATVDVTNAVTGAPGTSVLVTNLGTTVAAVFQFTIPAGAPGTNTITNTITAYAFSNQFLSSAQITTYSTNNITWGTSNFLARVNGLYDWKVNFGQLGGGGMAPGTNVNGQISGSYNGTNGWFVITNGFRTTNMISVSATGAGGGLGNAQLYAVDHPELLSRTNLFFGQYVRFNAPSDPNDAATKTYVDTAVANVKSGNFTSYTDTNNWFHFIYSINNFTIFDMANQLLYVPIQSLVMDGTGTNVVMVIASTNLTSGFTVLSSTNLNLGSAGFVPYSNWTTNTAGGLTTFTMPINFAEQMRFYRVRSSSSSSSAFYVPVAFNGGTLFPSNTWSLATITNGMKAGDIITVNSNGLKLVDVWMSNSTPVLKPHW